MGNHLDTLLLPADIAVIGASEDPGKWGNRLVRHTVELGYQGSIWAVNPRASMHIDGSTHVRDVGEIEGTIDLAVAAVPRAAVLDVVRACAERRVRNLVIPASGFGELGGDGEAEERQLLQIARDADMRLLGPNCFGLYSAPGAFNATPFTPIPSGDIALVSQSGNVAGHAFVGASARSMGFSHCVGLGNQLDISFADVVEWLAEDDHTSRIALYLEGLREADAQSFLESLDRCREAGKPVVVIKAGGSDAGRAVAMSHTGSLATDDRVWEEVLAGRGATRVRSIEEMFGVLALAGSPRPRGRRVLVVTDGGGDSIMAVDGVERHDLELATLDQELQARLDVLVPPAAPRIAGRNPITLDTAGGVEDDPEIIGRCLEPLVGVDDIDMVVVGGLYGTYAHVREAEMRAAEHLVALARDGLPFAVHSPIPVEHSEPLQVLQEASIPVFADMDRLLRALSLWLPLTSTTRLDHRPAPAASGTQWDHRETEDVLAAAGVPLAAQIVVDDDAGLVGAADRIGFPLCIKTADPAIVHKSDAGGVQLGIADLDELRDAARQVVDGTGSTRLLVMPSLTAGFEVMMGARSNQFGPVLVVGRGGIWTEAEADAVTFVDDVDDDDFVQALAQLRCAPMMFGGRGQAPLDVAALAPVARALMQVVRERPTISVDLNPVMLYEQGFAVADMRIVQESGT